MRSIIFFHSLFERLINFLNGKILVILAVRIGLVREIDSESEFCLNEIFNPIFSGLPGKLLFKLMSELNELLK